MRAWKNKGCGITEERAREQSTQKQIAQQAHKDGEDEHGCVFPLRECGFLATWQQAERQQVKVGEKRRDADGRDAQAGMRCGEDRHAG